MVRRTRSGFTLVELLVVMGIVAVLAAILFPVFGQAREKARQATCLSHQRQLAQAILMYCDDNGELLPPSNTWCAHVSSRGLSAKLLDCPSTSRTGDLATPDYIYNVVVAGCSLANLPLEAAKMWLTADGSKAYGYVADQDWRHQRQPIVSYVDGHVTLGLRTLFDQYGKGGVQHLVMPEAGAITSFSWFTAVDCFPKGSPYAGHILALTGDKLMLQQHIGVGCDMGLFTYAPELLGSGWREPPGGIDHFDIVGTLSGCDPSFLKISPNGSRIAIGQGYGAPIFVLDTSLLSATTPINLETDPRVKRFVNVNYYDGDWIDNRLFVYNGGELSASGVFVLDTSVSNKAPIQVLGNIPGASASVTVDRYQNIITGIGYYAGPPNRTGEIAMFAAGAWKKIVAGGASAADYETSPDVKLLAHNILSTAQLDVDAEGDLCVGGGDAFGVGGPKQNGYAALIRSDALHSVMHGGPPINPQEQRSITNFRSFYADPAADDSCTNVCFNQVLDAICVTWNPTQCGGDGGGRGSAADYWGPGVKPVMTIYSAR